MAFHRIRVFLAPPPIAFGQTPAGRVVQSAIYNPRQKQAFMRVRQNGILAFRRIKSKIFARFGKKQLVIGIVAVVVGVVLFNVFSTREVQAAWFNDRWSYRQPVTVSYGGTTEFTNFQVKIAMSALGVDALKTAGKLQSDCADLRFTSADGQPLPYWIEDMLAVGDFLTGYSSKCTTTNVIDGSWHQVVGVSDGTNVLVYVDAVLKGSIGYARGINSNGATLYVGWDNYQAARHFSGQTDDVRIYNYALTAEQIKEIYNGGAINFR